MSPTGMWPRRRGSPLLWLAALGAMPWGAALGQTPSAPLEGELESQALRFAQAWVDGDAEVLEEMMDPQGIRLQLQDGRNLRVPPARARAAISSFMDRYRRGEAELFRLAPLGENANAGFAEFRWASQVVGLPGPAVFSLFLALRRVNGAWFVTEVRVLS